MSTTGNAHGSLRARLSSPSGFVSVGLAMALLVGSVAVALGQGASKALLELGDGAVWLPTDPRGVVTLVDGSSGRPTAEIQLATGDGTSLQVVYRDGKAYAYDASTGVLTLIDDASMSSDVAVQTGGDAETLVLAGGGNAYVVEPSEGTLQVLGGDLQPTGDVIDLGGEVGSAVVDGDGLLYASLVGSGRVVVADADGVRGTLKVTDSPVAPLTVVGGAVHALDVAGGTVRVLDVDSVAEVMPSGLARNADLGALLVSESSDSDIAVIDPRSCQVVVLAVSAGTSATVGLPGDTCGDSFGAPVVVGTRVFVPDYSTGGTLVLDITGRDAPTEIPVRADGPGEFDLFVDDGNVVANDPGSNDAVIFTGGQEAVDVVKFDEEVAENATQPEETPAELPDPPEQEPDPSQEPDPQPTQQPEPGQEPTQAPLPDPTGTSTAPPTGAPMPTSDPTGQPTTAPPTSAPPTSAPPSTTEPPVTTPPPTSEPPATTPPQDPAAPVMGTVEVGNHRNVIPFTAGAGGGEVARFELRVLSGGQPTQVEGGNGQFVAHFSGCALHTFQVVAIGTNGGEAGSRVSNERPACPGVSPVRNLQQVDRGQDFVVIAWDGPETSTGPVQYRVERGNGELLAGFEAQGGQTRFRWNGLAPGTDYNLVVIARDDSGQSQAQSVPVRTADPPPWERTWTVADSNIPGTCATQGKRGGAWASSQGECKGWNAANRWLDNGFQVTVTCFSRGDAYPVYPGPTNWTGYFRTKSGDWIRSAVIAERTGDNDYGAPAC
ncbi:hypothetical protein GCM10028777_03330 [Angustibacter speluncae]